MARSWLRAATTSESFSGTSAGRPRRGNGVVDQPSLAIRAPVRPYAVFKEAIDGLMETQKN